jgi:hypothetical protein
MRIPEEDAPARGVRTVTREPPLDLRADGPSRGVQVDAPTRGAGPGPDQDQSSPADAHDRGAEREPGLDHERPNQPAADLGPEAEPGPAQEQGHAQGRVRTVEGAPDRGADGLHHSQDLDHAVGGAPARGAMRVPARGLTRKISY